MEGVAGSNPAWSTKFDSLLVNGLLNPNKLPDPFDLDFLFWEKERKIE